MELVTVPHGPGTLHLRVHVVPQAGLTLRVYHDLQVYDGEAASRVGAALAAILDQGACDPRRRISALDTAPLSGATATAVRGEQAPA
jgi:hypothetical protein